MDKEIIPGEGYRGRVGLNKDIEKGNVFLELNNVTGSDGGDYLCQVTSGDRTVKITVRLNLREYFMSLNSISALISFQEKN